MEFDTQEEAQAAAEAELGKPFKNFVAVFCKPNGKFTYLHDISSAPLGGFVVEYRDGYLRVAHRYASSDWIADV